MKLNVLVLGCSERTYESVEVREGHLVPQVIDTFKQLVLGNNILFSAILIVPVHHLVNGSAISELLNWYRKLKVSLICSIRWLCVRLIASIN